MSESTMRSRVLRELRKLDAIPVENPAMPGTPDVNFAGGWMELKWLRRWPRRADTTVQVEHFTPQQRRWLVRRARVERTWLLLQVQREWLLFHGPTAAEVLGRSTRGQLHAATEVVWTGGLPEGALLRYVIRRLPMYGNIAEGGQRQDMTFYEEAARAEIPD